MSDIFIHKDQWPGANTAGSHGAIDAARAADTTTEANPDGPDDLPAKSFSTNRGRSVALTLRIGELKCHAGASTGAIREELNGPKRTLSRKSYRICIQNAERHRRLQQSDTGEEEDRRREDLKCVDQNTVMSVKPKNDSEAGVYKHATRG